MIVGGSGNMGDVTDVASCCRSTVAGRSRINGLRVYFTAGSGTATLSLKVDSHRGTSFDRTIASWTARGNGADVEDDFSIVPNSSSWRLEDGDVAVLEWTDPGTSTWIVELDHVGA